MGGALGGLRIAFFECFLLYISSHEMVATLMMRIQSCVMVLISSKLTLSTMMTASCISYVMIGLSFKDARLRESAKRKQFGRRVGETRSSVARRLI